MTGGTTAVRNTPFEIAPTLRLPKQVQLQRVQRVIREELTQLQRETLLDYYFRRMTISQIAEARGVHKSTVCRTLHRAEEHLRRYLKY